MSAPTSSGGGVRSLPGQERSRRLRAELQALIEVHQLKLDIPAGGDIYRVRCGCGNADYDRTSTSLDVISLRWAGHVRREVNTRIAEVAGDVS